MIQFTSMHHQCARLLIFTFVSSCIMSISDNLVRTRRINRWQFHFFLLLLLFPQSPRFHMFHPLLNKSIFWSRLSDPSDESEAKLDNFFLKHRARALTGIWIINRKRSGNDKLNTKNIPTELGKPIKYQRELSLYQGRWENVLYIIVYPDQRSQ